MQVNSSGVSRAKVNVAIIGCGGAGVHSIVDRQTGRAFGSDYVHCYDPTLEDDEPMQSLTSVNGEPVVVNWYKHRIIENRISDWGLAEDKRILDAEVQHGRKLFQQVDACVLVYSCTNRYSLEHLTWLWNNLYLGQQRANPDVQLCNYFWVVANKIDWPRAEWELSLLEGDGFSSSIGATLRYMSARTGEGTEGFAQEVAARVYSDRREEKI
ncbi:hypothetical protein K431DRAFT_313398 [Polychaeton citri CBS 116435]|uniref:Uncharacterized protein n=1 Tax=Polychaeton citri CBS 116435 TaxID=1314669 RepID=A0A9P4Q4F2_9PEZI|nr:hypothetical protein K431DRAFT_313398 [Polychaeton citri CBS 116435]